MTASLADTQLDSRLKLNGQSRRLMEAGAEMRRVFVALCGAAALMLSGAAHAANVDFSLYGDYRQSDGYLTGTFFGLADSGSSLPTSVYFTVYPYHNQFTPFSEYISGQDFLPSGWMDIEGADVSADFQFLTSANSDDLEMIYYSAGEQSFSGDFQGWSIYTTPADDSLQSGYLDLSVSSAPEPSGWALLITGLATVGGILRWRRRSLAIA